MQDLSAFYDFSLLSSYIRDFTIQKEENKLVQRHVKKFIIVSSRFKERRLISKTLHLTNLNARCLIAKSHIQDGEVDRASAEDYVNEGYHNPGDKVADRYIVCGVLGKGGASITYEAKDDGGEKVALKVMSLRKMRGWKDLDLFERECKVLRSLKHPNIPQYVDYFEVEKVDDKIFYIVQKIANGHSLSDLVKSGWHASEDEAKEIALQVLDILNYLGTLKPPVIHRDIKPENVIWDLKSKKASLIDFGAVQDYVCLSLTGSTVVGTYGYMSPEQFQNRASLQTDLYGLGATILYILSHQPPSSFPQKRLKINFKDYVPMSSHLANILEKLLQPAPEDRFQSPVEVITALKAQDIPSSSIYLKKSPNRVAKDLNAHRPAKTNVQLSRSSSDLKIILPPLGITSETIGAGTFALAWNAFLAFWTSSAIRMGAPLFFPLISIPFWFVGIGLSKKAISGLAVSVDLLFDLENFSITWKVGNFWSQKVDGKIKDIISVRLNAEPKQNGEASTSCCIEEGVKSHTFGHFLTSVEKNWIVKEISDFLEMEHSLDRSSLFTDSRDHFD